MALFSAYGAFNPPLQGSRVHSRRCGLRHVLVIYSFPRGYRARGGAIYSMPVSRMKAPNLLNNLVRPLHAHRPHRISFRVYPPAGHRDTHVKFLLRFTDIPYKRAGGCRYKICFHVCIAQGGEDAKEGGKRSFHRPEDQEIQTPQKPVARLPAPPRGRGRRDPLPVRKALLTRDAFAREG